MDSLRPSYCLEPSIIECKQEEQIYFTVVIRAFPRSLTSPFYTWHYGLMYHCGGVFSFIFTLHLYYEVLIQIKSPEKYFLVGVLIIVYSVWISSWTLCSDAYRLLPETLTSDLCRVTVNKSRATPLACSGLLESKYLS